MSIWECKECGRSMVLDECPYCGVSRPSPKCPVCDGRGWHTAGGNDPMPCGRCEAEAA